MRKPTVRSFFDEATHTASYVAYDPDSRRAVVIDPVLNYCAASGRTSTDSADAIIDFIAQNDLTTDWVLETHIHADHLTASAYLKEKLNAKTGIGANVALVQKYFGELFNAEKTFAANGSQFDRLFTDEEKLNFGELEITVMHTPGHTPACITYVIGDAAFVGDTLFMPDYGSARCDFPGGDAKILYRSVQKILALPPETRLFTGHDYKAPGRDVFAFETTVEAQRTSNIHFAGTAENEFVSMREARDEKLSMPALILPAVQVNMRAGKLPPAEPNGVSYLKIPVNAV